MHALGPVGLFTLGLGSACSSPVPRFESGSKFLQNAELWSWQTPRRYRSGMVNASRASLHYFRLSGSYIYCARLLVLCAAYLGDATSTPTTETCWGIFSNQHRHRIRLATCELELAEIGSPIRPDFDRAGLGCLTLAPHQCWIGGPLLSNKPSCFRAQAKLGCVQVQPKPNVASSGCVLKEDCAARLNKRVSARQGTGKAEDVIKQGWLQLGPCCQHVMQP